MESLSGKLPAFRSKPKLYLHSFDGSAMEIKSSLLGRNEMRNEILFVEWEQIFGVNN